MRETHARTHRRAGTHRHARSKDSGGEKGMEGSENTSLRSLGINHGLDLISEIWDGNSAIEMSEGNFDDIRPTFLSSTVVRNSLITGHP